MNAPKQFTARTTYFLQEGKENLRDCLKAAFHACLEQRIRRIVIFTAYGEGLRIAVEDFCSQEQYKHIGLVGVTFPAGRIFTDAENHPIHVAISEENQDLFKKHSVPIVRAHMPFDPTAAYEYRLGTLGLDLSVIGEALNMFCGSMSLCVQAALLACDAGEIEIGEHVVSLTSDTAILAQATSTSKMLKEFVIREIICKPAVLSISRKEIAEKISPQMKLLENADPPLIIAPGQTHKPQSEGEKGST